MQALLSVLDTIAESAGPRMSLHMFTKNIYTALLVQTFTLYTPQRQQQQHRQQHITGPTAGSAGQPAYTQQRQMQGNSMCVVVVHILATCAPFPHTHCSSKRLCYSKGSLGGTAHLQQTNTRLHHTA